MGQFEGHFGICLAYGGDFGVILGPVWAYKRRMAGMMRVVAGLMVSLSAPRGPINRKYTYLRVFFKIIWSKAAAADLAKPPFRGQKSDSFERKCSKSFSKIVLPMQARTTFFKKCHAKSE